MEPPRELLQATTQLAEPLLTCHQAAELLAVKPAWVYDAIRSRRLTCVRVGRHIRLLRSDLERFVAQHRTSAAPSQRRIRHGRAAYAADRARQA
jgi:excisionase family DNA binding protein